MRCRHGGGGGSGSSGGGGQSVKRTVENLSFHSFVFEEQ